MTLLGGVLQAGGVLILVADLYKARNTVSWYEGQKAGAQLSGVARTSESNWTGVLTVDPPPTLEARRRIEVRLKGLPAQLKEREDKQEEYFRLMLSTSTVAIEAAIEQHRADLRTLVYGVAGSFPLRRISIVLIVVGITAQTAGGLIGT